MHDSNHNVSFEAAAALAKVYNARTEYPTEKETLPSPMRELPLQSQTALSQAGTETTILSDPEVLAGLVHDLSRANTQKRAEAAAILGRMGERTVVNPKVFPALVQAALHDKDGGVRSQATNALGQLGLLTVNHPNGLPTLVQVALRDKDVGVRTRALRALGNIGQAAVCHPSVLLTLVEALRDRDEEVRFEAAETLGRMMAQGVRVFRRWWRRLEEKKVEELATL